MTKVGEELLNNMIRKYGHEHPDTIDFAQKAEEYDRGNGDDRLIKLLYYWKTLRLDKEIQDDE